MLRYSLFCLLLLWSTVIISQSWNGETKVLKNNKGEIVDMARIVSWPSSTPAYLQGGFDFHYFNNTRLHNGRIDLQYMKNFKDHRVMSVEERSYWRGNFAVYKSDSRDFTRGKLHRKGLGIGSVSFPVVEDGHYLVLILWGGNEGVTRDTGDGRMIYCEVVDQKVTLYDAHKI